MFKFNEHLNYIYCIYKCHRSTNNKSTLILPLIDLIACANEPNVSIPQLANLLIDRTQHTSWAVVFKSLISIHHLMSYGNERFTQYLATSNHSFELADFMDRTTPQGYNMSTFVRRYAKYINDKSISYRTLAIDLCKIRSG